MNHNEPLDLETLEALRALQPEGAPDVISELVTMFRNTMPPLLAKLHDAIARQDAELLYKSAHSLKGNSASLGAVILAQRLKEMEQLGRMKIFDGVENQMAIIESEYARALSALEAQAPK
jgi:two-component system, sensor histidine kinase and response regulator